VAKSKPTKQKPVSIVMEPGEQAVASYLRKNGALFNVSEMERMAGFAPSTLRHICAGNRSMKTEEYKRLQSVILPKLCEFVMFLQNYE